MKEFYKLKLSELRDSWIKKNIKQEDALWIEQDIREWFIDIVKNCSAYKTILSSRKVDIGYTNEEVTGKVFCIDSEIEGKCDVCKLLIEKANINEEELK